MGKIILEFDSIEEKIDARDALDGYKWKLAMSDLDEQLRSIAKYGAYDNIQVTQIECDLADKLREEIRIILDGYGINLEH